MIAVASFSNLASAGVALSVLEGSGISARLENVESSVNLSGGPAAIRVMVAEADYDTALKLLASETSSGTASRDAGDQC